MASTNDAPFGFSLPGVVFNTAALSGSTAAAGQLSGSVLMVMNNSGANPGTYTTRTPALMYSDGGIGVGSIWWVLIVNGQATGTLTLAGGVGVTASGTLTVVPITARLFVFQLTSLTAATVVGQAWSFTATALAFGA